MNVRGRKQATQLVSILKHLTVKSLHQRWRLFLFPLNGSQISNVWASNTRTKLLMVLTMLRVLPVLMVQTNAGRAHGLAGGETSGRALSFRIDSISLDGLISLMSVMQSSSQCGTLTSGTMHLEHAQWAMLGQPTELKHTDGEWLPSLLKQTLLHYMFTLQIVFAANIYAKLHIEVHLKAKRLRVIVKKKSDTWTWIDEMGRIFPILFLF